MPATARLAGRPLRCLGLVFGLVLMGPGEGSATPSVVAESGASAVRIIMTAEIAPRSDRIFAAAGEAPTTPAGWAALEPDGRRLLALARQLDGESGQVAAWQAETRAWVVATDAVLRALLARDEADLAAAGEKLYGSCESCHRQFLKPPASGS